MKFKVAIFSVLLYLTSFLATMTFISSSALFVNHIGASSVSKVIIIFGAITPFIVFSLQGLYSIVKKYEFVFITYIGFFILALLMTCYISTSYSMDLSYWLFYVLGFTGYSLNKIVSWSLIGRYFNVIDSRRYFPVLTAFQEGGSITSALLISHVLTHSNMFVYVKAGMFSLLGIIPIFFFLLSPTAQAFKASKQYQSKQEQAQKKVKARKFLKKHHVFLFLAGMFLITIIFEQSLIYELNMTFGQKFDTVAKISAAFALYKMCESSFVIFSNIFFGRIMNRYVQLGNIFIIYSCIMLVAISALHLSTFWLLVPLVSFIRHSSKYFMFMPSYEQALNSLDSKMRIALKSLFEGGIMPICICFAGFGLMAFPRLDTLKYLNIVLLVMAVISVIFAVYFKRSYLKFHINRLTSDTKEFVIKSIQALGENKNYQAVAPLIDLLTQAESKIVKKNVILSFGRLRINSLLETLFEEAKNEQEELQLAAFESLSKYDSFLVQRFLIDLIHGGTCRSLWARMSLLKILYSSLGSTMVPILLPFLQKSDPRIVANTIEAMEPIFDVRIIEILVPYLNSENRRIKGNTIIVLYKFLQTRNICISALMDLYNSENVIDRNTFLYIIGRLKLKSCKKYLKEFLDKPEYKLNLALAYCKLEDQLGYDIFAELLVADDDDVIKKTLHHFSQLEDGIKLRVLSVYLTKISTDKQKLILLKCLKSSCFDFHEVRDYLKWA